MVKAAELTNVDLLGAAVARCAADGVARLAGEGHQPTFGGPLGLGDVQVACWEQMWPSTACGFGGLGGRAMTAALTVIVARAGRVVVYHDSRYAYTADAGTLGERVAQRNLLGRVAFQASRDAS